MPHRPALKTYLTIGRERGLTWTPLARQVLGLLWEANTAVRPYELRHMLSRSGRTVYPNSVYRQIRRLSTARLIVPIVSRRAVAISPDPEISQWLTLVCETCGRCQLVEGLFALDLIDRMFGSARFRRTLVHLECVGLCSRCG